MDFAPKFSDFELYVDHYPCELSIGKRLSLLNTVFLNANSFAFPDVKFTFSELCHFRNHMSYLGGENEIQLAVLC